MRKLLLFSTVAISGSLLASLAPTPSAAQAPKTRPTASSQAADQAAIRRLLDTYAESIDKADTTLAATIWKTTPDVSFIDPRGHSVGWRQIKENFYLGLMGHTFSARHLHLQPAGLAIHVLNSGTAAWAEFNWNFEATFRQNGKPLTSSGRETQVYEKTPKGWRLVHIHYSGPPVSVAGQGF